MLGSLPSHSLTQASGQVGSCALGGKRSASHSFHEIFLQLTLAVVRCRLAKHADIVGISHHMHAG